MVGHYLRKRLRSARFARRLASFSLILLVVCVLLFRFRTVGFDVFTILLEIVAVLCATAMLIALWCIVRVWRGGHEGGGAAVAAVLIAGLVAVPFALAGTLAYRNPASNFAQTDGIAGIPGGASAQADGAISGRVFAARASQVYQAVRLVLGDVGWTVSDVETADIRESPAPTPTESGLPPSVGDLVPVPTPRMLPGEDAGEESSRPDPLERPEAGEYRVAAVASDPILALPSDIEIRIVEDEAQAYLDLRSVSRLGDRDFGQNRRFIEDFLSRVDTAMVGAVAEAPAAD